MDNILNVENLSLNIKTYLGEVKAIRNVSFNLKKKEILVIVGESGCGKSMTVKTLMGLQPENISSLSENSKIDFLGQDLINISEKEMQKIRGNRISMIFQDPSTCLDPTMKIGEQIRESLKIHTDLSKEEIEKEIINLMSMVKISNPEKRVNQYPHEFSGGMRQRIMIAIALACKPDILIADEPTTALDVTIQADIMDLLKDLQEKLGMSIILVTHDLGIAAEIGDRIQVMYAGEIIESGTKEEIFTNPRHPYTRALLKSVPSMDSDKENSLYSLDGTPPNLITISEECAFANRCDYCMKICKKSKTYISEGDNNHFVRCWLSHPMSKDINTIDRERSMING